MNLIRRLLHGTEFKQLLGMVSPAFFDVLPRRGLTRQARTMARNYKDAAAYADALQYRAGTLAQAKIGVRIGDAESAGSSLDPIDQGHRALSLYFHQFLTDGPVLLDLRATRFGSRDGVFLWDPTRLFTTWDPEFASAMRDIYGGFYDDDDGRFLAGLDALGLRSAEHVFRRQFGTGDQRAVMFSTKDFVSTFHEAFILCRDNGDTLHPNFVGMGIALALLYDHLEGLGGGPFDVRSAYFAARGD